MPWYNTIRGIADTLEQSPWYYASGNPFSPLPNIFAEPNPHIHAQARRKVAAAYSMTNLVQLEPFIDKCSAVLRDRLEEFARSGTAVEISHWMQCYAFDVIGMMTVGSSAVATLLRMTKSGSSVHDSAF